MKRRTRGALAGLAAMLVAGGAPAAETPLPAEAAPLADHSLLIALAEAGKRLVAVGDRGVIVLSDDRGEHWAQARRVPVQVLLTGVCFFDSQHGVAVGHDLTVLTTADAGDTWRLAHFDPEAQRPLLDVWCGGGGRAIAVGAYAGQLVSEDSGAHWSERKFEPKPPPAAAARTAPLPGEQELDAGNGFHLNRIVAASASRLYIAAEAGHLYRSDDAGVSWQELPSPYGGSFFGVLPLQGEAVLAFGLRGSLYRSDNAGAAWQKLDSGTVAMLDGATRSGAAGVFIVGLGGVILSSTDGGHRFVLDQQADHADLSAVLPAGEGRLVIVGVAGTRAVQLANGHPVVKAQP
ncbi:MAG: hypothetical protein JSR36_12130 [Proteobacteria bacterium]|nr:hypothetical protein [Pseudomonadota bacterium]